MAAEITGKEAALFTASGTMSNLVAVLSHCSRGQEMILGDESHSIFPFTAPVLTMMRLGLIGVPIWQLAVSITVLGLSIVGGLLLAAKLLRAYMLMYGKRPNIGEIIRNLKKA